MTACSVVNPFFNRVAYCLFRLQEGYRYEVYSQRRHMGEVLYSAFCQGNQTLCSGKILLFLKFWRPSRLNQDVLLHLENSLVPVTEYHHFWTRWTGSLFWWQYVHYLFHQRACVANRISLSWDQILHCWNQTQLIPSNIIPNAPAVQMADSCGSIGTEWMHNFRSHNHLDSCQIFPLASADYDVGWVFPRSYPA